MIGAALTAVGSRADDEVRRRVADPQNSFGRTFETIGGAWSTVAVAFVFAISRSTDNRAFREFGYDLAEGVLLNGGLTVALKQGVRRERPDGANHAGFPSGHTSNAFVIATLLEGHFGWKAGAPAYVFASAMAISRIQRDKHYLSDVLAGATLGYVVGRSVVRVNGSPPDLARVRGTVSPLIGPHIRGLSFELTF
ncbi:MAG: phosphatase PAP2 family protein [Vicinamibacteria bacterium]